MSDSWFSSESFRTFCVAVGHGPSNYCLWFQVQPLVFKEFFYLLEVSLFLPCRPYLWVLQAQWPAREGHHFHFAKSKSPNSAHQSVLTNVELFHGGQSFLKGPLSSYWQFRWFDQLLRLLTHLLHSTQLTILCDSSQFANYRSTKWCEVYVTILSAELSDYLTVVFTYQWPLVHSKI